MTSERLRLQELRVLVLLADGTSAAAHEKDFGTSPWQLFD
jgi:hypothetical protein